MRRVEIGIKTGDPVGALHVRSAGALDGGCRPVDIPQRNTERSVASVARCAGARQRPSCIIESSATGLYIRASNFCDGSGNGQGGIDFSQTIATDKTFGIGSAGSLADESIPTTELAPSGDEPLSDRKRGAVIVFDYHDLSQTTCQFGWRGDVVGKR